MQERLLMQIEQRALTKCDQRRKVKVMTALRKNVQHRRDERLIEDEHNARKAQIDNFFANMKQRVNEEKTERAQAEQENQQKNELKDRIREHQKRFAEERKHINADNIDDAKLWPLEFNPPRKEDG